MSATRAEGKPPPKAESAWQAFPPEPRTKWDILVLGWTRTVADDGRVTVTYGHRFTLRYTFRFLVSWIYGILDSMKRITVDLADALYERLRLAAYTEHRSVSEVVRDRLASSLAELPAEEVQQGE